MFKDNLIKDFSSLFKSLEINTSLEILDLSNNEIKDDT